MEDECDRRSVVLARGVLAFDTADGAGENDFGHWAPVGGLSARILDYGGWFSYMRLLRREAPSEAAAFSKKPSAMARK
jgi:hypothetical protein